MLNLFEELSSVVEALEAQSIEYALCGGLAMAVWHLPRATVDIDILIEERSLADVLDAVRPMGYVFRARPMRFAAGAIAIERVSKPDPESGDVLILDLMIVTPEIVDVWNSRTEVRWDLGVLSVVTKEGLIKLKTFRSSGRDLDDIEKLRS